MKNSLKNNFMNVFCFLRIKTILLALFISTFCYGQKKETYDTLLWGSEYGPTTIYQNHLRRMKIIEKRNESVNCPSCGDLEVKKRNVRHRTRFKFDKMGYPVRYKIRGEFMGRESGKIKNVYSTTGQLLRSDCYSRFLPFIPSLSLHGWVVLKYDSVGRLSEMQWYYRDSVPWCRRSYSYDLSGRVIKDQFYQPKFSTPDIPTKNVEYHYDTLGKLITRTEQEISHISPTILTAESHINYHYNENGQLLRKDFFVSQQLVSSFFLIYDSVTATVVTADTVTVIGKHIKDERMVTIQHYSLFPPKNLQWQMTVLYYSNFTFFTLKRFENSILLKTEIEIISSEVFPYTTVPSILDSQFPKKGKHLPWKKIRYYKTFNHH